MSEEVEKYVDEIRRIFADDEVRFDRMEALIDDMRSDIADARFGCRRN